MWAGYLPPRAHADEVLSTCASIGLAKAADRVIRLTTRICIVAKFTQCTYDESVLLDYAI